MADMDRTVRERLIWIGLAALLGPRLCAALIPEGLPVSGGLPLGFTGSLIASVVLFAPPIFVLGQTSPFLIRLAAREGREGRTTGAIYGVGTLGSLAGEGKLERDVVQRAMGELGIDPAAPNPVTV